MKNPKSILITGGSSGIGKALCLAYSKPGTVISFCARDETRVNEVVESVRSKGAEVDARILDVTNTVGMKNWIRQVDDKYPIDLIIANSGIGTPADMSIDDRTKRTFDVNVYGVFNTIHPALERMRERGRGQIAIMSSLAGYMGVPNTPAYSASKSAIKAYGRAIRSRYGPEGIEVSVICPGWIHTPMTEKNKDRIPFFVSMEHSVRFIRSGLERNRGLISFPPSMRFLVWWLSTLPDFMIDWLHPRIMKR